MIILMLDNSYIFTNNMPQMLADLTRLEVVHHPRGGARLVERLNPNTAMDAKTTKAFAEEQWDCAVL